MSGWVEQRFVLKKYRSTYRCTRAAAGRSWQVLRLCSGRMFTYTLSQPKSWLPTDMVKILILKTIGNRKGDCAWSCSRWQTPEKICKSQRTNQCHSLRTLYWFVLCNLLIFSCCVCHLEQLHAQSPFLFPTVFSINLIPFFRYFLSRLLAVLSPGCSGMCCFTWASARSQQLLFVVLAAGLWCFTAGCHIKSPLFPQPPLKQRCAPRWEKYKAVVFSQSNALRD